MRRPVKVIPGTQPEPDATKLKSVQYVATDKVYFRGEQLCTWPGWSDVSVTYAGAARSIYGFNNGTYNIYLIGTHKRLYCSINGTETNITPLKTSTTAIANSLDCTNTSTTVNVNATAHGLATGDRVKINAAADFGGFTAATHINKEHIITVTGDDDFTFEAAIAATSDVTGGGGASTTYQKPIDAGSISQGSLSGFGGGDYDTGDFGGEHVFSTQFSYPRIWSFGRHGNGSVVMCPGDNGIIYTWSGDTAVAPVKATNSPTANWVSTKGNSVRARGAGSVRNGIQNSGLGDITDWTPGPTSTSFSDDWEEVGRMISDAYAGEVGLIFTEDAVVIEEWVDYPKLYDYRTLMKSDGILGPLARLEFEDEIIWAGNRGFYRFNGEGLTKVDVSCHEYIFGNEDSGGGKLNRDQRYKSFWQYDADNGNCVFHFPADSSSEPNMYVAINLRDGTATLGTRDLTASEQTPLGKKRLTLYGDNTTHKMYRENNGVDAGSVAMSWYAESHWRKLSDGKVSQEIMEIIPDAIQTGDITLALYAADYPQDPNVRTYGPYTISPTTRRICPQVDGCYVRYRWAGNTMGGSYRAGAWDEDVQEGTEA